MGEITLRLLLLLRLVWPDFFRFLWLGRLQILYRNVEKLACLEAVADNRVQPLELVRSDVICLADRVDGLSLLYIVHIHLLSLDAHYLV